MKIQGLCVFALFLIAPIYAQEQSPDLIQAESKFYESGSVSISERGGPRDLEILKVESGSINGISYNFFYADGSGKFAGTPGNTLDLLEPIDSNWRTRCTRDAMSDKVWCSAKIKDLTIYAGKTGNVFIKIGSSHFPGTSAAIRIDGGRPINSNGEGYFTAKESAEIMRAIGNGSIITTRYQEWPYERFIDKRFELYGYEEVYSYLRWAVSNIN